MSLITENVNETTLQKDTMQNLGIDTFGVINKNGRIVNSMNLDSLKMSHSKQELFFMKIALRNSMQSDFDGELGKVNYCITQRGNRKFITIPISENNTLLVVVQNNVGHEKIISSILNEISYSN